MYDYYSHDYDYYEKMRENIRRRLESQGYVVDSFGNAVRKDYPLVGGYIDYKCEFHSDP